MFSLQNDRLILLFGHNFKQKGKLQEWLKEPYLYHLRSYDRQMSPQTLHWGVSCTQVLPIMATAQLGRQKAKWVPCYYVPRLPSAFTSCPKLFFRSQWSSPCSWAAFSCPVFLSLFCKNFLISLDFHELDPSADSRIMSLCDVALNFDLLCALSRLGSHYS
jgi:hypothetical protein